MKNVLKQFSYLNTQKCDIQKAHASLLLVDTLFHEYASKVNFKGVFYLPQDVHYKNNISSQITTKKLLYNFAELIYENYLENPAILTEFTNKNNKIKEQTKKVWNKFKDVEITKSIFEEFMNTCVSWWHLGVIGEDKAAVVQEKLILMLTKNNGVDEARANEILSTLSHPDEISILSKKRMEFISLCLEFNELDNNIFNSKLESFCKEYFYAKTNFYSSIILTPKILIEDIKKELQQNSKEKLSLELSQLKKQHLILLQKKKELERQLNFNDKIKKSLKYFYWLVKWVDERKIAMQYYFYFTSLMLKKISDQVNIAYDDLSQYNYEEMKTFLETKKTLSIEEIKSRKNEGFLMHYTKNEVLRIKAPTSDTLLEMAKGILKQDFVKGTVASTGGVNTISGFVRIIKNPNDKLKDGEILVTSMTRPEFVPLMKHSSAIVTDEGGLACHAAIVAREINKPCIIGTRQATDTFKDGQKVELDLKSGIVKLIK